MYEALSSFAQTWGLLSFIAMFGAVLVYALWPKNQDKFDRAAAVPLEDEGPLVDETEEGDHLTRQEPSHG